MEKEVIGDFGGSGWWRNNLHTWNVFSYNNLEDMVAEDFENDGVDELVGDYGSQCI